MADTLAHAAVGMRAPQRRPLALASLCTVLFLTFLDNTVVSVALASIQSDLHGGVSALQWVVGAYALTFASFMLAFGMLGDRFGRKKSEEADGLLCPRRAERPSAGAAEPTPWDGEVCPLFAR